MKTKTFIRIWQVSAVIWTVAAGLFEPETWYLGPLWGIILGMITAIFADWTNRVVGTVRNVGWIEAMKISPPEKPPLGRRIVVGVLSFLDRIF